MNLLIVDDSPTNLKLLRAQLESEGHAVFEAHDGVDALALLKHQRVDAVIADILMPRMDGYRFCEEIRRHERLHDLPIILYTATYTLPSDVKLALDMGADKYLKKPASLESLVAALHEVIAIHRAAPPPRTSQEVEVLKEYNEVLVLKLEEKALQLEQSNRDLAAREARLSAIFEHDPECIKLLAADGSLLEMNPAGLQMIEADSFQQVANRNLHFLVVEEYRNAFRELTERVFRGESGTLEFQITGLKGGRYWLETHATPLPGERGEVTALLGITRNITERKKADDRIVYLNRVYAMLSGINTLIVRVRDRDELFRDACRIAVEHGGFRMAMVCIVDRSSMKIVPLASVGKDEELLSAIKDILSSSVEAPKTMIARAISEKNILVSNYLESDPRILFGKKYAESGVRSMVVLPLIVSDEAVGVLALYASEIEFFHEDELTLLTQLSCDIAFAIDHIEKQERLDYLAYYDVLTGLANRSLFIDRVTQYMRSTASSKRKLALYLFDLERFKNINDSLGQPAGDELLRQVGEWLTCNAGDVNLLARVGSNHFAAVMPEVMQGGDVARVLQKSLKAFLNHPFRLNDSMYRIAAKVGVALFPDDGADADTLFKHAEAALKNAKVSGNRYVFHNRKMTESVAERLALENQLREAMDKEEFVLHYQPKVNLASGKLTSAEALIRWNDPRTGLVPPTRFIPILEETGLIHEVGRWALRKVIEDNLRWRAAGMAVMRIAVNVSPLQLRNHDFIAEIRQAISIDAHAAAGLELEITESLIMEDVKHSIASLQTIRAMGISVAIDDFGTGFSSLSYLAKLPLDTLKIDRSFVNDMTSEPEGTALVSTIINLAHSLKLKVVAEGVETEEQSRLLRMLNCDEIQGYLFSKPVPSEIFETRFLVPDLEFSAGDYVGNSD